MPALAHCPVMTAFVATVVPWSTTSTSRGSSRALLSSASSPSPTAFDGFVGVDGTLASVSVPALSSARTQSVNVPPVSIAIRRI